jgi:hypothetical protein
MRALKTNQITETSLCDIYHRLATRRATANETVLISASNGPVTTLFSCVYHNHLFVASISLVVLLGEILSVTISNVPFNQGITWYTFLVSYGLSVAILGIMLITFVALFFKRRSQIDDKDVPDSLIKVMILLANSHWREDLLGISLLNTHDRDLRVNQSAHRYQLIPKWRNGSYGATIDYAEE